MIGQAIQALLGLGFAAPTIIDLLDAHTNLDLLGHKNRTRLLAGLAGDAAVSEDLNMGTQIAHQRDISHALRRIGRPETQMDPTHGLFAPELEGAVQRQRAALGEIAVRNQRPSFEEIAHNLGFLDTV